VAFRATLAALLSFIRRDEDGQGLAEYALILALVALLAILALIFLGSQISAQLGTIGNTLQSQQP
jgi:pilus assembly protein Flp/PilA